MTDTTTTRIERAYAALPADGAYRNSQKVAEILSDLPLGTVANLLNQLAQEGRVRFSHGAGWRGGWRRNVLALSVSTDDANRMVVVEVFDGPHDNHGQVPVHATVALTAAQARARAAELLGYAEEFEPTPRDSAEEIAQAILVNSGIMSSRDLALSYREDVRLMLVQAVREARA